MSRLGDVGSLRWRGDHARPHRRRRADRYQPRDRPVRTTVFASRSTTRRRRPSVLRATCGRARWPTTRPTPPTSSSSPHRPTSRLESSSTALRPVARRRRHRRRLRQGVGAARRARLRGRREPLRRLAPDGRPGALGSGGCPGRPLRRPRLGRRPPRGLHRRSGPPRARARARRRLGRARHAGARARRGRRGRVARAAARREHRRRVPARAARVRRRTRRDRGCAT